MADNELQSMIGVHKQQSVKAEFDTFNDMKSKRRISPLRLCILYILFVCIWLYIACKDDPSIAGWALTFDTGFLIIAGLVYLLDFFINKYASNKMLWWVLQLLPTAFLVYFFVRFGLPSSL